ncbi:MAG: UvrD-helicase domain-containing protein, partial [Desulfococcaceae bacterium]
MTKSPLTPEPFDLLHSPLIGTNLLEASAGTGKTYTIAGLFVRLVLEENIEVNRILVVTFTEAATEEL